MAQLLNLSGKVTRTGWVLPQRLSREEWIECGRKLALAEGAVQWWLGDWWAFGGDRQWGEGEQIAEEIGVDYRLLYNYGSVARRVQFSVRTEKLTFGHHERVASLSPTQQKKWLALAIKNEWSINQLRSEMARALAIGNTRQVELDAAALGRYTILLADPPWQYEWPPMGGSNRSIENHYPTLTLEQICALPVGDIAHENSVLFLWATAPKLPECLQVLDAWGFLYRTNAVGVKDKIGMGYHFRNQHELLLVGKRGELAPPLPENRPSSVFEFPRTEHSEKPEIVYTLIEGMYPDANRKIELFARSKRPGWDAWGNDISIVPPDAVDLKVITNSAVEISSTDEAAE